MPPFPLCVSFELTEMLLLFLPPPPSNLNCVHLLFDTHHSKHIFILSPIFFFSFAHSLFLLGISSPCSDVDEYGFKRDCNFDYVAYDNIMTNYYKVLTKRRIKWQSLMKNPPNLHNRKSAKLKRYVRKGIPGKKN